MKMKEKIIELADKLRVVDYKLIDSYYEGYIGKEVYEVTLVDGRKKKVERIVKNRRDGDAVVIIPITKEGKYVIEVQSRPNMIDTEGVAVEFPAGMVDGGEEFVDAAKRELLEETGYVAENFKEIEWHYQDQGCSNAIIKTFVATGCWKKEGQHLDSDEMLSSLEITLDELAELFDTRVINDASSKIATLLVLRHNKKD
jgi:ADP-ribose pyrophosphatase